MGEIFQADYSKSPIKIEKLESFISVLGGGWHDYKIRIDHAMAEKLVEIFAPMLLGLQTAVQKKDISNIALDALNICRENNLNIEDIKNRLALENGISPQDVVYEYQRLITANTRRTYEETELKIIEEWKTGAYLRKKKQLAAKYNLSVSDVSFMLGHPYGKSNLWKQKQPVHPLPDCLRTTRLK